MKKEDLIFSWALDLEKLAETTGRPLNTISTEIRRMLRTRGYTENQIQYVTETLPKRFKK
jgi:hypothetical protein